MFWLGVRWNRGIKILLRPLLRVDVEGGRYLCDLKGV